MTPIRATHVLALLLLATIELDADGDGVLDDDDAGDEVLVATDAGTLGLWSATELEVTSIWRTDIPSANRVALTADSDTVYDGPGSEISAFPLAASSESQEALWTWSAPDDVVALVGPGGGAVYAMTTSTLHAIADGDGGELWSIDLLLDLTGVSDDALVYDGGDLILGGNPVRRIDPNSGAVTNEYETTSSDVSGLAISGGVVYVAAAEGVLALSSGALVEQWVHATAVEVDAVAVGSAGVAFAERGGGVGSLAANGNPVFVSADQDVYDGLLAVEGLVVAARSDGALLGFDAADGASVWVVDSLGGPVGGLDATGLTIFYGHANVLDGVNVSDGSALFSLSPSGRPVAIDAL